MAGALDLDAIYNAAGEEWNVHPALLKAIGGQESGGTANPDRALSTAGAQGRQQIMPGTQKHLGMTDPSDAAQSIFGSAKYMSQMLDQYKTPELALAAYNAGPGRIDAVRAGQQTLPDETAKYVPAVTQRYRTLMASGGVPQGKAAAQPDAPAAGDNSDPFSQALKQPAAAAPAADNDNDPFSQALKQAPAAVEPKGKALPPDAPPGTTAAGVARNVGAGLVDAGAGVGNVLSDPFGNIIGKPLVTLGVAAHDALAPMFGGQKFTDQQRAAFSGDTQQQAGSRAVNALAGAVGVDPANVPATPAEAMVRTGVGGAVAGGLLGGAGAVLPSAAGAGAGQIAYNAAPETYKDLAAFAGNVLGGGAGAGLQAAARPGLAAAGSVDFGRVSGANALGRFVAGADRDPVIANRLATALGPPEAAAADQAAVAGPQAGLGGPQPQAAGAAATPAAQAGLTPAQTQAYRSTAEGSKLLEPQQIGQADRTEYIPGVRPNTAELEQTVNTARELKSLNITAPAVSQEAKEIAANNSQMRARHFENLAGSDVDVANLKAARGERFANDIAKVWENKGIADVQPILDAAQEIKASPDGKRPVVRNAIDAVTRELYDDKGALITDPELVYGVRKHIDDLMSKEAGADDPKIVRAMANLQKMKETLDGTMNDQVAPGFAAVLKNFADDSRPIDTKEVLQKFEPKLYTGPNQNMTYGKVQGMMKQIVDSRQAPGLNPMKSIPDETMAELWALRDDLRRTASAQELARTPGSDTAQNAFDMAKGVAKMGGMAAAHMAVGAVAPVYGNMALQGAKNAFGPLLDLRTAAKQTKRGRALLNPTTPLTNRLAPP